MGARFVQRGSHMPGVMQVAKVTVGSCTDIGATDREGQVPLGTSLASDGNTTGAFAIFKVPFGTVVTNMLVNKLTAASAGNLKIGDTDDDGFWPASDLLSTATGVKDLKTLGSTAEGAAVPAYKGARFYTSTGDTFDTDNFATIYATVTTAALTAGKMDVYIQYYNDNTVKLP